jgi:hypothetical protein
LSLEWFGCFVLNGDHSWPSLAQSGPLAGNMQHFASSFVYEAVKPFMSKATRKQFRACSASLALCIDLAVLSEHLSFVQAGLLSISSPLPVLLPTLHACLWHNMRTSLRASSAQGHAQLLQWLCNWAQQASMANANLALHSYAPIACELMVDNPKDLFPEVKELPRMVLGHRS